MKTFKEIMKQIETTFDMIDKSKENEKRLEAEWMKETDRMKRHETLKGLEAEWSKAEETTRDSLLTLLSVLNEIDCSFIGETYCLNNYETGHTVYNSYSDLVYIFAWSELEALEAGKAVKLFARKPDEADRELIEMEGM